MMIMIMMTLVTITTVTVVVHAAIIAINDAVDHCVAMTTVNCLLNPAAHLCNIVDELGDDYQSVLYDAKQIKKEIAFNKVTDVAMQWSVYS